MYFFIPVLVLGLLFLLFAVLLKPKPHEFIYWPEGSSPTLADLFAKYRELGYDQLANALEADMLPCISLRHSSAEKAPRSKLGGLPDLPPDVAWPAYKGKSLSFIAQLDLSEIPESPVKSLLPPTGMLYFFFDQAQEAWGYDPKHKEGWAVIFSENVPDDSDSADAPEDLSLEFNEGPIELVSEMSLPDLLSYPPYQSLDKQQQDQVWSVLTDYDLLNPHPDHHLFGHVDPVQGNEMPLECQLACHGIYLGTSEGYKTARATELAVGAADWRLLLQVNPDDEAEMMFGDVGSLYFWITVEDLANRRFDNVWAIMQCF